MNIRQYINSLAAIGKHSFTRKEIEEKLSLSANIVGVLLNRLKKAGEIVSPARGYYIMLPMEYRSLGCLPPSQLIPDLMLHLDTPYYVALLSAAEFYGAAHQKPQVFQVMVPKIRKNLHIGKVRVHFHKNKYLSQSPTKQFNTDKGYLYVSTPEATALDLIAYPGPSAGLSNVFTVLEELVESMDLKIFRDLLCTKGSIADLQRIGYLFEQLQQERFAEVIEQYLKEKHPDKAVLEPRSPLREGQYSKRWKLMINISVENDL